MTYLRVLSLRWKRRQRYFVQLDCLPTFKVQVACARFPFGGRQVHPVGTSCVHAYRYSTQVALLHVLGGSVRTPVGHKHCFKVKALVFA